MTRRPIIPSKKISPLGKKERLGSTVGELLQRAFGLHQQGQLTQAQALYRQILQIEPEQFDALQLMGVIETQTHNFQQAIHFFDCALKINPRHPVCHNNRAMALQELGYLEDAVACYSQAISLKPDYAVAYNGRGISLQRLGHLEEALSSYDMAITFLPSFSEAYNNRGIALQLLGRFEQSLESYDRAIAINPHYPQAFNNRGIPLQETGRLLEALDSYSHAISLAPDYAEAYRNRGWVLQQLGRFKDALESYSQAIILNPLFIEAYIGKADSLKELGQLKDALAIYDLAALKAPNNAQVLMGQGALYLAHRNFDGALANFNQAIELEPTFADAYNGRGNALQELERFDESLIAYSQAIILKPECEQAYNNRGNVLKKMGELDQALESFNQAIAINPNYAQAYYNQGTVLKVLERLQEAIVSFDKAIAIEPDFAEAYCNRGNALQGLNQFESALQDYEKAIFIRPDFAEAYSNQGSAFQALRKVDAAIASFKKAVSLKSDFAEAHWNLSLCLLLAGQLDEGWEKYEWRWKSKEISLSSGIRNFSEPLWLGDAPLQDKTILLYAEQGLGDTIQFARYVRQVAKLGAQVLLEVQPSLVPLFQNLAGVKQLLAKGEVLPHFDFQCPLLSLPLALKTNLETIPPPLALPPVQGDQLERWKSVLGKKSKPRVGLVWSGSLTHRNDHNRSLSLESLLPCLPDGIDYICLQKEIRPQDQEVLARTAKICDISAQLNDFSDTAAVCECMDVIISVDTSVAHLAATLNKPTWLLLHYYPDWRWMLGKTTSPWYPSIGIYQQPIMDDWTTVLNQIQTKLLTLVNQGQQ